MAIGPELHEVGQRHQQRVVVLQHALHVEADDLLQMRQFRAVVADLVHLLLVAAEDHPTLGVRHDVGDLAGRLGRIGRHRERSDALRTEVGEQPGRLVLGDQTDPVTAAEAELVQRQPHRRGWPRRTRAELVARQIAELLLAQRHRLRAEAGLGVNQTGQGALTRDRADLGPGRLGHLSHQITLPLCRSGSHVSDAIEDLGTFHRFSFVRQLDRCVGRRAEIGLDHRRVAGDLVRRPVGDLAPEVEHDDLLAMSMTTPMSCSMSTMVVPSTSRTSRMNADHVLLLLDGHAGHRLVEEQELGDPGPAPDRAPRASGRRRAGRGTRSLRYCGISSRSMICSTRSRCAHLVARDPRQPEHPRRSRSAAGAA